MAPYTGIAFLLVALFLLLYERKRINRLFVVLRIKRRKKIRNMTNEIISKFIGKDCYINLGAGGNAEGKVNSIGEGWIELESETAGIQAVNIDYISKIREYPKNKNGKRKTVFE